MEALKPYLNKISTYFSEGAIWHNRAANECRRFAHCRGWGRWHEAEAKEDFCSHQCFEKIVRDNLKYSPIVDGNYIIGAYNYQIQDNEQFKNHHEQWVQRENLFIATLNSAIQESRTVNMELYKFLCCTVEEVQNEAMRVGWVYDSLLSTGWEHHDIRVVSKWLHDYFAIEYKGGKIDFNIG